MKLSTFVPILPSLVASAAAIEPVVIRNNTFYVGDSDERFYIRGVDYQPGGSSNLTDPLGDPDICGRDIPYFQDLGLNTIRVYSLDNTLNHSECMEKLADAGIYVILDVNTPRSAISRSNPSCSYNLQYLTEVFATVDAFASFNNTLGFFAANELVNDESSFEVSPYIKAVTRDIKQYIAAQDYRTIPVGYSAADVAEIRYELAHYLNCGDNADERIDMLGVNDYSWCGDSSFTLSGYNTKVSSYSGYSIPIFMSEFGCNEVVKNRPFTEVEAIYSTRMSSVFSGGLVYEYIEESNDYGLVNVSGSTVTPLDDYYNLRSMLNSTSNPTGDGGAASYDYSECPTGLNFSTTVPDQPSGLADLIKSGPDDNNYGFEADTIDSCDDDEDDNVTSSSSFASSSIASSSVRSSSRASSSASKTSVDATKATTLVTSTVASSSAASTVASVSSITSSSKNEAGPVNASNMFMSLIAVAAGIFYF